jgi:hypothetical protein
MRNKIKKSKRINLEEKRREKKTKRLYPVP